MSGWAGHFWGWRKEGWTCGGCRKSNLCWGLSVPGWALGTWMSSWITETPVSPLWHQMPRETARWILEAWKTETRDNPFGCWRSPQCNSIWSIHLPLPPPLSFFFLATNSGPFSFGYAFRILRTSWKFCKNLGRQTESPRRINVTWS